MSQREHFKSKTPCKTCGAEIWLYKSNAGKYYPTNSENSKDFHQCKKAPQTGDNTVDKGQEKLKLDTTSPDFIQAMGKIIINLEERKRVEEESLTVLKLILSELQKK